jgi:predicted nucleic acid-binding protein
MTDGDERQFVDTNVLVYAHDSSAGPRHERAREVLRALWDSGAGCLSIQVLQEFYVVVTKKVPKPLAPVDAQRLISDLAAWTVHSPSADDILRAIEIQETYRVSFWDAMVVRSASQLGCATMLSEDLGAGQVYEGVRVVNPFV